MIILNQQVNKIFLAEANKYIYMYKAHLSYKEGFPTLFSNLKSECRETVTVV